MYRKHDVINLRPQPPNVLFNQERIHGNDPRTAISRECGLAHVIELRIAKEADLDTILRENERLSSFSKVVSASDMSNACGRKSAKSIQEPSFFRDKGGVIGEVYKADSRRCHHFGELSPRAVHAALT